MHMADALLSPAVGGALWAASSGTIAYCSAKVRKELDDRKVPLMGVLGAFLFAAQMINFTIPGTGSSGHLGGGLLLAILLGPHAAFLTIASVLVVQALFFADGGLLALGCNIFNLGVFPAFVAYPYVYRKIAAESGRAPDHRRGHRGRRRRPAAGSLRRRAGDRFVGDLLAAVFAVRRPDAADPPPHRDRGRGRDRGRRHVRPQRPARNIAGGRWRRGRSPAARCATSSLAFLAVAVLTGGVVSWFASGAPDGLEWSIAKTTGNGRSDGAGEWNPRDAGRAAGEDRLPAGLLLPEARGSEKRRSRCGRGCEAGGRAGKEEGGKLGDQRLQESSAGLITLALVFLAGFLLKRQSRAA